MKNFWFIMQKNPKNYIFKSYVSSLFKPKPLLYSLLNNGQEEKNLKNLLFFILQPRLLLYDKGVKYD